MHNLLLGLQSIANNDTKVPRSEWKPFVDVNNQIIQSAMNRHNLIGGRALILGAGNGNDIDVSLMERLFDEVVIVDIDDNALERFMLKTRDSNKFKKIILDLSGIGAKVKSISELSDHATITYLNSLQSDLDFSTTIPGSFDFVMNCNYTTQLISPFFMSQLNQKSREVIAAINACNERVVTTIFDQILNVLNAGGLFLHSTDTIEYKLDVVNNSLNPAGEVMHRATSGDIYSFHNHPEGMKEVINRGLLISGSVVPSKVIKNLKQQPAICFNYWPFSVTSKEIRIYLVCIYEITK